MKSMILASALALSPLAFANTATFEVKGMHCGACTKAVEDKVCHLEGVTACKAELTNEKKQMGKVTVTTAEGIPVDAVKVEQAVSDAGYHVVRSPLSSKK